MMIVANLPEDVLFEVFSRVGNLKALFRCAVACRRWLGLFTDSDFLRRLWPEQDRGRLLGFFLDRSQGTKSNRASSTYSVLSFVPSPGSPIGYGDCVHRSFFPDDHDIYDSVAHLTSHRGITLVRFLTRSLHVERGVLRFVYGVCDPVTGAHDVLPPLDCNCVVRVQNAYAILTAADDGGGGDTPAPTRYSMFSQMLLVSCNNHNRDLHVHSYSSATRRWSKTLDDSILPTAGTHLLGSTAAVVHRGAARWLYVDKRWVHMLSVEAGTTRASLTKLPIIRDGNDSVFLCTDRDGSRLSIAYVHAAHIDIWNSTSEQQDDGVGANNDPAAWQWHCVQEIGIPPEANFTSFYYSSGVCLCSNGGTLLVSHGAGKISYHVFVLNLETAALEKVVDLSETRYNNPYNYYKFVPYKMDLPGFFLGQLGSQKRLITYY